MGLAPSLEVDLSALTETPALRLDSHYYELVERIRPFATSLTNSVPLQEPWVTSVTNGKNLPEKAYDIIGQDSEMLYVSVGALSLFALQPDRCIPLLDPSIHNYGFDVEAHLARDSEVLVTRSSGTTPGVAWPVAQPLTAEFGMLPSGFGIRIDCSDSELLPEYLAAVLNHPVWRAWSNGLATGKSQLNLSHESLATIEVPHASSGLQERVKVEYLKVLAEIAHAFTNVDAIKDICDSILEDVLAVDIAPLQMQDLTADEVLLADCGRSPSLRMDGRHFRSDLREVADRVDNFETTSLGSLLTSGEMLKGIQPRILDVDSDLIDTRVVATSSIQSGSIPFDLTKPTTEEWIEKAGDKAIRPGDLLMTLDGEGSLGKAAVFTGDYQAIPDTHVAILRTADDLSPALACFINSSLGQAQVLRSVTGSTGQTQISVGDVQSLAIPDDLLAAASTIAAVYEERLSEFEAPAARARRLVCDFSARLGGWMQEEGLIDLVNPKDDAVFNSPDELRRLLSIVERTTS